MEELKNIKSSYLGQTVRQVQMIEHEEGASEVVIYRSDCQQSSS